jgi:hypothetical protein
MSRASSPRLAGPALALALLAGCGQLHRTPLSDEYRKAITTSKAVGNLSQQEIATSIERSGYGAAIGGLLGAVVDTVVENNRAGDAEAGAAVLRDLLTGYDPRPIAKAALERELAKSTTLKGPAVELRQETKLDRTTLTAFVDAAGTDAVLVMDLDYRLSPKFDFITVTGVASLLPTRAAAAPVLKQLASTPSSEQNLPSPLLYRGVFFSTFPAPTGSAGIERWTADKGVAAKVAIEGGIAEVVRMVTWDLEQEGPKGAFYEVPGARTQVVKPFGLAQWLLLDTQDGRTWYRATTGELASVGESYPGLTLAPASLATQAHAAPPTDVAAPRDDGSGRLTFEVLNPEYMKQGGGVEIVKYSQVPGDVALQSTTVKGDSLVLKGQLGLGQGSFYAGLGPRFFLRPRNAAMDLSKFGSVTLRVAASTRELRIGAVGPDPAARNSGCYPVYTLEVGDQMKEYTIPLSRFATESRCSVESAAQTLTHVTAFEVVSLRVTQRPLTVTVGPITLNR